MLESEIYTGLQPLLTTNFLSFLESLPASSIPTNDARGHVTCKRTGSETRWRMMFKTKDTETKTNRERCSSAVHFA
ncbi:hypothetical protein J6590_017404, partial [Homalodisca vitripennis]